MFAIPRVMLKPLVPAFPCFSNVVVSLMEKVPVNVTLNVVLSLYFIGSLYLIFLFYFLKPHIDFGMKVLGGDLMSIPGLYRLVQVRICWFLYDKEKIM